MYCNVYVVVINKRGGSANVYGVELASLHENYRLVAIKSLNIHREPMRDLPVDQRADKTNEQQPTIQVFLCFAELNKSRACQNILLLPLNKIKNTSF